jgi:hypothetical protein
VSGINISEDARHWIGLLQYNPSTDAVMTLAIGKISSERGTYFKKILLMFFSDSALLKTCSYCLPCYCCTGVQRSVDNNRSLLGHLPGPAHSVPFKNCLLGFYLIEHRVHLFDILFHRCAAECRQQSIPSGTSPWTCPLCPLSCRAPCPRVYPSRYLYFVP